MTRNIRKSFEAKVYPLAKRFDVVVRRYSGVSFGWDEFARTDALQTLENQQGFHRVCAYHSNKFSPTILN